ncbi:MAG TPA: DUF3846 domain-containing protein [Candidatus Avoscillospira stercorigallinarum]|uniref:DUF3846 domain-containing protein n=1 Tax=Candidatus Avoscillospira stercorigallinarum TaxID=2840708 RepID=A0A9D1CN29_9FIRM|nr:DUF3846 domain-containing protein [Candidatus Avoscillospira stercorigallinarum]
MKIIYKAPGLPAEIRDVPNTLEALQGLVGGYIETVTVATDAAIICNEEGRLIGLEPNCTLLGVHFVGPIVVAGVAGEEFTDLPEDGIQLFMAMFKTDH